MTLADPQLGTTPREPRYGLFLLVAQLTLLGLYLLLVIMPFLVNGLHNEPETYVAGGRFDPKGLWPNNTEPFGFVLALAAFLVWGFGWLLTGALGVVAAGMAAIGRRRLGVGGAIRVGVVILVAIAYLNFMFSDSGELISAWMAD